MKGLKNILYNVTKLFVIETLLQVIYYGITIKYFDPYNQYEKIGKILFDAFYIIGTIKLIFFLPLYLLFYIVFIGSKNNLSVIKQSFYHAIFFLLIYIIISFLLPGDVASRIIDTLVLTCIAFITSFLLPVNRGLKST